MGPERFGHFAIHRKIADGGMGRIFLARDLSKDRMPWVALKRLHAHLAENPENLYMLQHEGELMERLRHPNVARLHERGKVNGEPFVATRFMEGASLSELLREVTKRHERLPVEVCASLILQMLEGLAYAHELRDAHGDPQGIIHRDLTPQNLFITFCGTVKLIDFGVARARDLTRLTKPGVLKGKYSYMSPEQMEGKELDARSDIFSAGVVAWETFAGRRLFAREADGAVIAAVMSGEIPALTTLEPEVAEVIARALETDREARFPSARAMHDALAAHYAPDVAADGREQLSALVRALFADRALPLIETTSSRSSSGVEIEREIVSIVSRLADPPGDTEPRVMLPPPSTSAELTDPMCKLNDTIRIELGRTNEPPIQVQPLRPLFGERAEPLADPAMSGAHPPTRFNPQRARRSAMHEGWLALIAAGVAVVFLVVLLILERRAQEPVEIHVLPGRAHEARRAW